MVKGEASGHGGEIRSKMTCVFEFRVTDDTSNRPLVLRGQKWAGEKKKKKGGERVTPLRLATGRGA